jgi:hypothetical protein
MVLTTDIYAIVSDHRIWSFRSNGRTHRTEAQPVGATAVNLEWTGLMPSDVEVLPKFKKRVRDREAKQLCINIIEEPDGSTHECNNTARTRGLCNNCHYAFRMERLGTPKTKRLVYENNRIRQGTLMPDRQGKRLHPKPQQARAS